MKQRWLILTSSTGSGHDTRAYALKEWAQSRLGEQVEIDVWHVLEDTSKTGRFGVDVYNWIQRTAPWMHQVYWQIAEAYSFLNLPELRFGRAPFVEGLRQRRPHLLISMHDSLNGGYFGTARRELGRDRVRCVTYCGEWSAGFGFSWHWVDRHVDRFYTRTAEVVAYARRRGVASARVFRNLLRPQDFGPRRSKAEITALRQERFGLAPDCFTVLLATGMLGADKHLRMLEALLPLGDRVQAIALCGRNEQTKRRLEAWSAAHPAFRLSIQGFTDEMKAVFEASDLVITRGGSNTLAECLFHARPMLFHSDGGIMPQECCTRRFVLREGVGERLDRTRDLTARLAAWLENPAPYEAMVTRLEAQRASDDHPEALVDDLFQLGAEVARS